MRFSAFIVCSALAFATISTSAFAAPCVPGGASHRVCVGASCAAAELGKTVMDGDNKNIIACLNCTIDPTLCPTSPQWKAISNANNLVCPPNVNNPNVALVMTGIVNGVPQCRTPEPAGTRAKIILALIRAK